MKTRILTGIGLAIVGVCILVAAVGPPSIQRTTWTTNSVPTNGIVNGLTVNSGSVVGNLEVENYIRFDNKSNNAVGYRVQNNITSGHDNQGYGREVQFNLTSGSWNSGFGWHSQYAATTADDNSAYGHASQYSLVSGLQNNAFGVAAQTFITSGFANGAFGFRAQYNITTNIANNAFGHEAQYNITGDYNNAFGFRAQNALVVGYGNNAYGANSQRLLFAGTNNNSLGKESLDALWAGNGNNGFGHGVLALVTNGMYNTGLGHSVFATTSGTRSNLVGIGAFAGYWETGSDKLYIDSRMRADEAFGKGQSLLYGEFGALPANQTLRINGNVGINIAPTTILELGAAIRFINDGQMLWGSAHDYGLLTWDTGIAIIGGQAGKGLSLRGDGLEKIRLLTNGNVGIGTAVPGSRLSVSNNAAIGATYAALAAPANSLIVEGKVGVGTSAPSCELDVNGNANVVGTATNGQLVVGDWIFTVGATDPTNLYIKSISSGRTNLVLNTNGFLGVLKLPDVANNIAVSVGGSIYSAAVLQGTTVRANNLLCGTASGTVHYLRDSAVASTMSRLIFCTNNAGGTNQPALSFTNQPAGGVPKIAVTAQNGTGNCDLHVIGEVTSMGARFTHRDDTNLTVGATEAGIYSTTNNNAAAKGELYVVDGNGTHTLISPHSDDAPAWLRDDDDGLPDQIEREFNQFTGVTRWVNKTRMTKLQAALIAGVDLSAMPALKKRCIALATNVAARVSWTNHYAKLQFAYLVGLTNDVIAWRAYSNAYVPMYTVTNETAEWVTVTNTWNPPAIRPIRNLIRPKPVWAD